MAEKICSRLSAKRMRKQMQLLQRMQEWLEEVAGLERQEVEAAEDQMGEAVVEAAVAEQQRWARC